MDNWRSSDARQRCDNSRWLADGPDHNRSNNNFSMWPDKALTILCYSLAAILRWKFRKARVYFLTPALIHEFLNFFQNFCECYLVPDIPKGLTLFELKGIVLYTSCYLRKLIARRVFFHQIFCQIWHLTPDLFWGLKSATLFVLCYLFTFHALLK